MTMKTLAPKVKLQLVRERRSNYTPMLVRTPNDLEKHLRWMRSEAQEIFVTVHLNAKQEIIAWQEISRGTLNASLVHPREVFKGAILNNAHSIIVAHNHPTGDSTPSPEDIEVTTQLLQAGNLLGICLVDHVIIGDSPYSIREQSPSFWKQ